MSYLSGKGLWFQKAKLNRVDTAQISANPISIQIDALGSFNTLQGLFETGGFAGVTLVNGPANRFENSVFSGDVTITSPNNTFVDGTFGGNLYITPSSIGPLGTNIDGAIVSFGATNINDTATDTSYSNIRDASDGRWVNNFPVYVRTLPAVPNGTGLTQSNGAFYEGVWIVGTSPKNISPGLIDLSTTTHWAAIISGAYEIVSAGFHTTAPLTTISDSAPTITLNGGTDTLTFAATNGGHFTVVGNDGVNNIQFAGHIQFFPTANFGGTIQSSTSVIANSAFYVGSGPNIVYRCLTAGTLPIGALTISLSNCGSGTSVGLYIQ
jgi:hypothetical protein